MNKFSLLIMPFCMALYSMGTYAQEEETWRATSVNIIGLSAIIAYLLLFYFGIDYNLPKTALMLPVFLRGFGYVVIAINFLTIKSLNCFNERNLRMVSASRHFLRNVDSDI